MSTLTMNPTTAGSETKSSIFLQQFSFKAFLERNKLIKFYLSTTKVDAEGKRVPRAEPLPFLKFGDTPIWVANKIKHQANTEEKMNVFADMLLTDGDDYSVGLMPPNVDKGLPDMAWVIFKNGEGVLQPTVQITYEDMIRAQAVRELKK